MTRVVGKREVEKKGRHFMYKKQQEQMHGGRK